MQGFIGFASLMLLIGMVLIRSIILKKMGVKAFVFGRTDKRDFLIPPTVSIFIYQFAAYTFGLPKLFGKSMNSLLFNIEPLQWLGVIACAIGLIGMLLSLISFGKSFRVGIDDRSPGKLVTHGIFAFSRNPVYTSFAFNLAGYFMIFPSGVFLFTFFGGILLFHRQIRIEEKFLIKLYGDEYLQYAKKVRRYL